VKVHWTNTAVEHLLAIYEFIARDSPTYGQRTVDRLTARSRQLAAFPLSGAVVSEYQSSDIREIVERPYRLIYRVTADRVDVLAVVHGAQLLPPRL
jgi:toxin ParE1/3/4